MAPKGGFKGASVSKSDVTISSALPTYYCLCGEYCLVGNLDLASLARREVDNSYVLRNVASEANGGKHIYKLNATTAKEAVYVRRRRPDGKDGYEKIWKKSCPRCELQVAYETTDPRDKKQGDYSYVLAGALSDQQSTVPTGAFGDEPPPAA